MFAGSLDQGRRKPICGPRSLTRRSIADGEIQNHAGEVLAPSQTSQSRFVSREKPFGIAGLLLDCAIRSADKHVEPRTGTEAAAARNAWVTLAMNDDGVKARCLDEHLDASRG